MMSKVRSTLVGLSVVAIAASGLFASPAMAGKKSRHHNNSSKKIVQISKGGNARTGNGGNGGEGGDGGSAVNTGGGGAGVVVLPAPGTGLPSTFVNCLLLATQNMGRAITPDELAACVAALPAGTDVTTFLLCVGPGAVSPPQLARCLVGAPGFPGVAVVTTGAGAVSTGGAGGAGAKSGDATGGKAGDNTISDTSTHVSTNN
jgi:hypothetical protein